MRSSTKLLLHCMNCMFHPRLRKAFKSLMFTLSHTRSYGAHTLPYTQVFGVCRVCCVYIRWIGSEFTSQLELIWHCMARSGAHLKRPIRSPEHVCMVLRYSRMAFSYNICIFTVHTYNKLIINIMDMQFCVYSGALVYIHMTLAIVLRSSIIRRVEWPQRFTLGFENDWRFVLPSRRVDARDCMMMIIR